MHQNQKHFLFLRREEKYTLPTKCIKDILGRTRTDALLLLLYPPFLALDNHLIILSVKDWDIEVGFCLTSKDKF